MDKTRLTKKLGAVSAKTMKSTLGTLQEVFTSHLRDAGTVSL